MTDKIESLLGFAVRANKIIYGLDNIEVMRKKRYLIIICPSLSQRGTRKAVQVAEEKKIPLMRTKKPLEDVIHKTGCKAIALTDRQMSQAVVKLINDNYEVLTSEVK